MINEGAKILEEGISARPSDIDVVWVNGYGWPVYRGGPMQYADTIGLKKIVETLKGFQEQDGDDFWQPAALLEKHRGHEYHPLSASQRELLAPNPCPPNEGYLLSTRAAFSTWYSTSDPCPSLLPPAWALCTERSRWSIAEGHFWAKNDGMRSWH